MTANTFFVSDTHFNHKKILEYTDRGKTWDTVEAMNEGLRDNWNKTVKDNSTIYMLGDVAFWWKPEPIIEYLKTLKGKKYLILGNHDHEIIKHRERFISEGVFESIRSYQEIKIDKQKIVLFHFPMRTWHQSHRGAIHLFGHVHGDLLPHGKSADVGIDSPHILGHTEYRPLAWEEVKAFMEGRELTFHHPKVD